MDARRRRIVAGGALLLASAAARGHPGHATHAVVIDAFTFKPSPMTVKRGEHVRWTNADPVPHTVTAAGVFDSGSIAAGAAWTFTAEKAGRFDYVCAFHPTMTGTLIVV